MSRDTIDDLSRRVHRWVALEGLLFETLGRWSRELPEPTVKRAMATWCHRHAWHAELWRARLPVIPYHEIAEDFEVGDWLAPLREALGSVSTTADAIVALSEPIAQALEDALNEHRDAIDARLDGPTARILDLVSSDLAREASELAALTA